MLLGVGCGPPPPPQTTLLHPNLVVLCQLPPCAHVGGRSWQGLPYGWGDH